MFDHPHAIGAKAEHRTQKSLSIECGVETDISISKWTRLYLDNKHLLDILEEGTQGWGKAVEVTFVDGRLELHNRQVLIVLSEAPGHEHLVAKRGAGGWSTSSNPLGDMETGINLPVHHQRTATEVLL
jgi:hypothetical protein